MCGIAGIWGRKWEHEDQAVEIGRKLTAVLSHRGPDHSDFLIGPNSLLAHTRLSIIDLSSAGRQPMVSDCRRYALAFNGEIYNYRELAAELKAQGVRFRGGSDTEVFLHLLIREGENALSKVNGFFAFAFVDREKDSILLARDPMGIKPLYYGLHDGALSFASEMSAFKIMGFPFKVDRVALSMFMRLTYVPAPFSMWEGVRKLEPGKLLCLDKNGLTKRSFTSFGCENPDKVSLRPLLDDAVQNRLVSDVPVGMFLSGGVDSSIVAALVSRHRPQMESFSIGFRGHGIYDESEKASRVARHLGVRHNVIQVEENGVPAMIPEIWASMDEPFGDSSALAMYLLCMHTKEQVSVALSGDGADELFGGYRKHRAELMMRSLNWLPWKAIEAMVPKGDRDSSWGNSMRSVKRMAELAHLSKSQRYFRLASFDGGLAERMLMKPGVPEELDALLINDLHDINDFLTTDQHLVLPNDMLKKVDLMSMAHALEVRTPFLDKRVVDWANALPSRKKLNWRHGKLILRKEFSDLLPESVFSQRKRGFEVPLRSWLFADMDGLMEACGLGRDAQRRVERQGLFNWTYCKSLLQKGPSRLSAEELSLLYCFLVFQAWYHQYVSNG